MDRDPYEVLGIARDATLRQATAAYRRLAELYHPDRLRGFRRDVQHEGARHLQEANAAIRVLRHRLRGPLVAPGHEHHDGNGNHGSGNGSGAAVRPAHERHVPPSPSDEATAAAARICYVVLRSVDAPDFQVRWAGPHASATLTALKNGHRLDGGPIRQVEWGTYAALLEGDATRRLLEGVLPDDDDWRSHPVDVMAMAAEATADLPARLDDGGTVATLGAVVSMLDDDTWYDVLADTY